MLQCFERGVSAAGSLQLLARLVQRRLHLALFFLHFFMVGLVLVEQAAEGFDALALGVVLAMQLFASSSQRGHVGGLLFGLQRVAAARQVDALPIQVVELGAFHLGRAVGFAGVAGVSVPALLPVGELRLGAALRFGGVILHLLQSFEFRFAFGQRQAQGFDLFAVGGDVRGQFGMLALAVAMGALQAFGAFAVVPHLLFDPRDLGADLVDVGLHGIEVLVGVDMPLAHGFQLRLDLALAGQLLLDLHLGGGQPGALAVVLALQTAVFERTQFGFLACLFFLQQLPALGGAGLAVQVFQLLVHLVAHVAHAVEVFAGGLDAAFGFLAALLVLGDAGGLLQVGAQFLRIAPR
ncbi:hypothetical protein [Rhodanobacter lindaniclasticus]